MKRSILIALMTGLIAVSASAQRKVLIEEFTSSTCGPCAGSDPLMEQFEEQYLDKIVVVKYHQDYPSTGDIMYKAFPKGFDRGNLYGVHQTGIPWVEFNGITNKNPGYGLDSLKSITDRVMDHSPVYYTLGVSQQITADSLIATITVKAGTQIDPEARLTVVVAEANVLHQASNGRIYHTSAARASMPAFDEAGAPTGEALAIAANGEQTFRFAVKLNSVWNRGLLQLVAFVQNPSSGEVEGVETNKPYVVLERKGGTAGVVGSSVIRPHWVIKNSGTTAQNVIVTTQLTKTTPYSTTLTMADGSPIPSTGIVVGPGQEKEIVMAIGTSGENVENQNYGISIATSENVGIIGAGGLAWPESKKDIFIDAGVGSYQETYKGSTPYQQALSTAKMPVSYLSKATADEGFSDFSHFKNIFYAASYAIGLYSDNGDIEKIKSYVNGGGNLVFSGMRTAGAYNDAGMSDFTEEVFGVIGNSAVNSEWTDLAGVPGDVVGNGLEAVLANILVTQPLELSPTNPTAAAAFKNENDDIVGVHAEHVGGGKTMYLSFEPGNISSTTQRRAVVAKIVDWLNGVAAVKVSDNATSTELSNYPNPFNPSTTIEFSITEAAPVTLVVKDMMGREVARPIDFQMHERGTYSQPFDASELASGTYMYELTAGSQKLTQKMTLNK